jgi:CubicO group peptidase (beta-lactamase class C family)
VRQLLSHQAGVVVLDESAPTDVFFDWDLMCRLLAAQQPAWSPGSAHGESALFFGHLVGELVRRLDGRSPGTFLKEVVCGPIGLDFFVGLSSDELARAVEVTGLDDRFRDQNARGRPELYRRATANPPGAQDGGIVNSRSWRSAEIRGAWPGFTRPCSKTDSFRVNFSMMRQPPNVRESIESSGTRTPGVSDSVSMTMDSAWAVSGVPTVGPAQVAVMRSAT